MQLNRWSRLVTLKGKLLNNTKPLLIYSHIIWLKVPKESKFETVARKKLEEQTVFPTFMESYSRSAKYSCLFWMHWTEETVIVVNHPAHMQNNNRTQNLRKIFKEISSQQFWGKKKGFQQKFLPKRTCRNYFYPSGWLQVVWLKLVIELHTLTIWGSTSLHC